MSEPGFIRPVKLSDFGVGCLLLAIIAVGVGAGGNTTSDWLTAMGVAFLVASFAIFLVCRWRKATGAT